MKIPKNLNPNVAPQTVSVYPRHSRECPKRGITAEQKAAAKTEKRCNCPKWIYLFHDGKDYRFSAGTRSWENAEKKKRDIEDALDPTKVELRRLKDAQHAKRTAITVAVEDFLSDTKKRNLAPETLAKLRSLFEKQFLTWTQHHGLFHLEELTTSRLTEWRSTWLHAPLTSRNRQELLRGFFRFCIQQGWLKENPASGLSRIKVRAKPTDYFRPDEFDKLLQATYSFGKGSTNPNTENYAIRIRTLLLLMRCSGLRIGDAVTLERSRLAGDNISLYQAKTGEPVFVPLPPEVAEALRQLPPGQKPNSRYFFWNGNCTAKSAVSVWTKSFRRVFRAADLRNSDGTPKRCHPHMLRDTFAVEMLLADVSLEKVSMLLGHSSIKTTEKHYAPWVRARQQQLEDEVKKAWQKQPMAIRAWASADQGASPPNDERKSANPATEEQRQSAVTLDQTSAGSVSAAGGSLSGGQQENAKDRCQREASGNHPRSDLFCVNGDDINTGEQGEQDKIPPSAPVEVPLGSNASQTNGKTKSRYRSFPYTAVATMWAEGKTIMEIATAIDRLEDGIDPAHKVRSFLTRMHTVGYKDDSGRRIKLPYRAANVSAVRDGQVVPAPGNPCGLPEDTGEMDAES